MVFSGRHRGAVESGMAPYLRLASVRVHYAHLALRALSQRTHAGGTGCVHDRGAARAGRTGFGRRLETGLRGQAG